MVKIRFLSHSFFHLSSNEINILIDPFIHNSNKDPSFKRLVECPVTEKDLENVRLILVSHEHFDHFDKKAIEFIAKRDNAIIVSHDSVLKELNLSNAFKRPINVGETLEFKNVKVTATTAHHPNSFYPIGFLVDFGEEKIYHAGDTDLIDEFNEIKCDVALLPIGGKFTMDIVDGVKATKSIKPEYAIPMHYDTFSVIKSDPREFKQKIEKSVLSTIPTILKPGKTFTY